MHADNAQHLSRWREEQDVARNSRVVDLLRATEAGEAHWATVAEFCTLADVGRSWLYASPHWEAVREARERGRARRQLTAVPGRPASSDASLRSRLATALEDNKRLRAENQRLSDDLANALGLVRDLRARQARHG
jgi:hypothetical protein